MKKIYQKTFMSWKNEDEDIRAIALCDVAGFFYQAINCIRDSQMGEKDEKGVYSRIWWGDNISCYGHETETLRPATYDEVKLYLEYCSVEEEADTYGVEIDKVVYGLDRSCVVFRKRTILERFKNWIRSKFHK